jgi:hypothetical protein
VTQRPEESTTTPFPAEGAGQAASARRAVLPWRRRIRDVSRFDFTPFGGIKRLSDDPFLGWVPVLVFFPLWLPAAFVGVLALVELLLAVVWLPVALVWRKARGAWPVELLDEDGRLLHREYAPSWDVAGRWVAELRGDYSPA